VLSELLVVLALAFDFELVQNPRHLLAALTSPQLVTMATDNKQKHLEFIQGAINRMASNLFLLKGWTITLIAGLFALSAKDAKVTYFVIAYFPAFVFWALDGYFLMQERRFRSLYDHVRQLPETQIDFSMDTEPFKKLPRNTYTAALMSQTLKAYYGSLIVVLAIVMAAILLETT